MTSGLLQDYNLQKNQKCYRNTLCKERYSELVTCENTIKKAQLILNQERETFKDRFDSQKTIHQLQLRAKIKNSTALLDDNTKLSSALSMCSADYKRATEQKESNDQKCKVNLKFSQDKINKVGGKLANLTNKHKSLTDLHDDCNNRLETADERIASLRLTVQQYEADMEELKEQHAHNLTKINNTTRLYGSECLLLALNMTAKYDKHLKLINTMANKLDACSDLRTAFNGSNVVMAKTLKNISLSHNDCIANTWTLMEQMNRTQEQNKFLSLKLSDYLHLSR